MRRLSSLPIVSIVLGAISFSLLLLSRVFRHQSDILTFPHFYLGLLTLIIIAVVERPNISAEQLQLSKRWFLHAISFGLFSLLLVFTGFCCITYLNDFLIGELFPPIGGSLVCWQ